MLAKVLKFLLLYWDASGHPVTGHRILPVSGWLSSLDDELLDASGAGVTAPAVLVEEPSRAM